MAQERLVLVSGGPRRAEAKKALPRSLPLGCPCCRGTGTRSGRPPRPALPEAREHPRLRGAAGSCVTLPGTRAAVAQGLRHWGVVSVESGEDLWESEREQEGRGNRKGPVLPGDIPCCQMRLGTSEFCELGGADLRGRGGGSCSGLGSAMEGDSGGAVSSAAAFGTWGEDHEGSLEHSFRFAPICYAASPAQIMLCCLALKIPFD